MDVTLGLSKISCTVKCMQAAMQCFQNALVYFAMAVSYTREMLMK